MMDLFRERFGFDASEVLKELKPKKEVDKNKKYFKTLKRKLVSKMDKPRITTEYLFNKSIDKHNPEYILVLRQSREALWKRTWKDQKDYIVWKADSPPKPEDFSSEFRAFRFDTFESAMQFMLMRSPFKLKLGPNYVYSNLSIPAGERLWKIRKEKEPILPFLQKVEANPNCRIHRGYLRSLKDIESGEEFTI